jgi:hypothetical protein
MSCYEAARLYLDLGWNPVALCTPSHQAVKDAQQVTKESVRRLRPERHLVCSERNLTFRWQSHGEPDAHVHLKLVD